MAERARAEGGPRVRAWRSPSAQATEGAGEALASALEVGDVIALSGPLGAGKTRLVAGIARGLGWRSGVRSPSYTLVNEYRGRLSFYHVDLYRVETADLDTLGLEDCRERGVLAVEWGEKLPESLLADALRLEIESLSEHERSISARAATSGSRGAGLAEAWNSWVAHTSVPRG